MTGIRGWGPERILKEVSEIGKMPHGPSPKSAGYWMLIPDL
jgi:hypothetical protein